MASRSSVQEKGRTSHMGNRLPALRRLLLPGLQRSTYRLALPLAWSWEIETCEGAPCLAGHSVIVSRGLFGCRSILAAPDSAVFSQDRSERFGLALAVVGNAERSEEHTSELQSLMRHA